MEPRPIRELLIILRDNLKMVMKAENAKGMCYAAYCLQDNNIITTKEYNIIHKHIMANKPLNYYERKDGYFFKLGAIPPRLEWLNKQINNLPISK